jgi:type IV pilus assembly protein PilC
MKESSPINQNSFWNTLNTSFQKIQRVSSEEKAKFFHMLGNMTSAGVTLLDALSAIESKTHHFKIKEICQHMKKNILHGKSLSSSMHYFEDIFTPSEITLVEIGEESAQLDQILLKLAEASEKQMNLMQKIKKAFSYPTIVMITLFASTWIIFTFVVPKLQALFTEAGQTMPVYSEMFFNTGMFLHNNVWSITIFCIAFFLFIRAYIQTESGQKAKDTLLLRLPILGEILQKIYIALVARNLSYLMGSGVMITKSFLLTSKAMNNILYQESLERIAHNISSGMKLSEALAQEKKFFPTEIITMISVGEKTANIAGSSEKTADFLEQDIDRQISNLTTVLEPFLLFFVALFVGWFVFAVFGAIFSLTDIVSSL